MTVSESSTQAIRTRESARLGRRERRSDAVPLWLRAIVLIVAGYFVLPTLIVIPMSFSNATTFEFPPKELSLRLYENFFTNPAWIASTGNSFLVGLFVAVVATILGTAAALGLHQLQGRLARLTRTLLMVPLVAPSIVVAVAVYISFLQWHLTGTLFGYVSAHTAIALPFVLVCVTSSLSNFDSQLLRASGSLGATPWRSFLTITMPLISRGIVTGAVFAFVTSFDEVVVALFLRSPSFQTLPVQMYNSVTVEIDPTIAAASSIIVVIVTLIFLVPQLVTPKKRG